MDVSRYFVLPDGRLRAGWRLLLFGGILLASSFVIHLATWDLLPTESLAVSEAILAGAILLATWVMMRAFERRPLREVGLGMEPGRRGEMALGLAGGAVLVGGVTAAEWSLGMIQFQPAGGEMPWGMAAFLSGTGTLVAGATAEELLFRGYAFQRVVEASNGPVAVVMSSVIFGWLHAYNPNATDLSILNTMLAGVLLSVAYLKTRALWLPIGFHFAWNWSLGLCGLPISGLEELVPMPWKVAASPDQVWVHGGSYGPEGGVVATGALVVGIAVLLKRKERETEGKREQGTGNREEQGQREAGDSP